MGAGWELSLNWLFSALTRDCGPAASYDISADSCPRAQQSWSRLILSIHLIFMEWNREGHNLEDAKNRPWTLKMSFVRYNPRDRAQALPDSLHSFVGDFTFHDGNSEKYAASGNRLFNYLVDLERAREPIYLIVTYTWTKGTSDLWGTCVTFCRETTIGHLHAGLKCMVKYFASIF